MKLRLMLAAWLTACVLQAAPQINNLADLQQLEAQMQAVVEKTTAATISLITPSGVGSGSGVVVSSEGLILTAAHVIDGEKEMIVVFPDGREERATVLGANYSRDAAMAQLHGDGPWPYVEAAETVELQVGDFVVAMGHPKGYDPTRRPPVRFGRVMTFRENGYLTTDCTLIGGDSGGPLFDLDGRVIGIHSHIAPQRSVNNHASVNGFRLSWEKMLKGHAWGRLGGMRDDRSRPVLGVFLQPGPGGELVVERFPANSPARRAGVQLGDVMLSLNGVKLTDPAQMREVLVDYEPKDKVIVIIQRGADQVEKEVELESVLGAFRRYPR